MDTLRLLAICLSVSAFGWSQQERPFDTQALAASALWSGDSATSKAAASVRRWVRPVRNSSPGDQAADGVVRLGGRVEKESVVLPSGLTLPVQMGRLEGEDVLLQVGDLVIVSQTLLTPEQLSEFQRRSVQGERIVILNGPLHFHAFIVPILGLMWEQQSVFPGTVVEDIGTGNGVLALVALKLGAERIIGLDDESHHLEAAAKSYALTFGNAADPSRAIWKYDRLEDWYSLENTEERKKSTGELPTLLVTNFGPEYKKSHTYLLQLLLSRLRPTVAWLGGYSNDPGFKTTAPKRKLMPVWQVEETVFRDYYIAMRLSPWSPAGPFKQSKVIKRAA